MSKQHRFAIGQIVNVLPQRFEGLHPVGTFEIVEQLPELDRELQYKVRSRSEPFERMVGEGRLTPRR